jgi:hypothetical protein
VKDKRVKEKGGDKAEGSFNNVNKLFSESDTNNNNNNKDAKQLVERAKTVGEGGDGKCLSWLLVQVDYCDGKGDAEQERKYKNSYAYYKNASRSRKRKVEFICRTMLFICKLI